MGSHELDAEGEARGGAAVANGAAAVGRKRRKRRTRRDGSAGGGRRPGRHRGDCGGAGRAPVMVTLAGQRILVAISRC